MVSGHTHQPCNSVVEDPSGKPRLLTSASSLGRFAQNTIVENGAGATAPAPSSSVV